MNDEEDKMVAFAAIVHEYFMGNVADMVVKYVPCSVLAYRSEQTDGL